MEVCVGYLTEVLGTACLDVGVEPQGTLPDDRTGTYLTMLPSFPVMTEAPRPQVGCTLTTNDTGQNERLCSQRDLVLSHVADIQAQRASLVRLSEDDRAMTFFIDLAHQRCRGHRIGGGDLVARNKWGDALGSTTNEVKGNL
ncbi:hypothetical protein CKAH01_00684 [Colletotrichum kahawae]|uniref:Uncharacterized protein n=1 Tax=Colletotrichum kahawae TaxID=34407 RepID=A0AAD9YJU1_COLKA|nr:hypothetical protein CKAH01_00684 [Colletotrichum kahawae]